MSSTIPEIAPPSRALSIWKGSVWDDVDRDPVDVEDLDLEKSYVDDLRESRKMKTNDELNLPAKQTWVNPNPMKWPLYDIERLPEGWHPAEPDLDDNDIAAQIERCYELLDEGIMPHIFEAKLQKLEEVYAFNQMAVSKRGQSLSQAIIQRLDNLDSIWEGIYNNGDELSQLTNIELVMDAYRSGELEWTGLVTYWSCGQQLCQPRPFNWDEFEAINNRNNGSRSFWTEGYNVAFRLPGHQYWEEFEMLYDTGATMTRIFWHDVVRLQGDLTTDDHLIPIVGVSRGEQLTGHTDDIVIMAEVCLINHHTHDIRETPWVRIQCAISEGPMDPRYPQRLDGPWLRYIMHIASEPDAHDNIYVANNRAELGLRRYGLSHTRDRIVPRVTLGGSHGPGLGHLQLPPRDPPLTREMPPASRRAIEPDPVL
ncbi:hypothetical protein N7490_005298 [Penicillium lividum]|nr:hypothetical protein N7490_005298 [Penicillium lividum]